MRPQLYLGGRRGGGATFTVMWHERRVFDVTLPKPMRPIAFSLLAGLIALPLAAQEKLVESIEVRVVNVDVVVTDRAGNPVTGLTKDDFEILDNGKPQKIQNIYEVRPTSEAETLNVAGALEPTTQQAAPLPPREILARSM